MLGQHLGNGSIYIKLATRHVIKLTKMINRLMSVQMHVLYLLLLFQARAYARLVTGIIRTAKKDVVISTR